MVMAASDVSGHRKLDPILVPFIDAADERTARAYLDNLIHEHAYPAILSSMRRHAPAASILTAGARLGDGEDLRSESVRRVISRLGAIRHEDATPIGDFRGFVRITVRNLCVDHAYSIRRELNFSSLIPSASVAGEEKFSMTDLEDSLTETPSRENICCQIEQRGFLRVLWRNVCALPRVRRLAILYNFRDTRNIHVLPLLAMCGVVTRSGLAAALNVPDDNLERFLELLPMTDSQIAALLQITSREVISQRFAARRTLKRSVRSWLSTDT